jgi:hypothetical protein
MVYSQWQFVKMLEAIVDQGQGQSSRPGHNLCCHHYDFSASRYIEYIVFKQRAPMIFEFAELDWKKQ